MKKLAIFLLALGVAVIAYGVIHLLVFKKSYVWSGASDGDPKQWAEGEHMFVALFIGAALFCVSGYFFCKPEKR